jgi:hypothetical protein
MSFNAWESGARVSHGLIGIAAVIVEHSPDLVGLQEFGAAGGEILQHMLGKYYYFSHSSLSSVGWNNGLILSRFPIVKVISPGDDIWGNGVVVEVNVGGIRKEIAFFNSHLTAYPYGPYEVARGQDVSKVVDQCNKVQGTDIQGVWESQMKHFSSSHPMLLVGDHNIPSHLDGLVLDSKYHICRSSLKMTALPVEVPWPVSIFLESQGLVDAWREVYPDVTENAPTSYGFTWTTLNTEEDIYDRIDFVYYRHKIDELKFIPLKAFTVDKLSSSIVPYPTDHKVVVIDFSIQ